ECRNKPANQFQSTFAISATPEIGFAAWAGLDVDGGEGRVDGGAIGAAAGAAACSCASLSFRHAANCFMSCAAVAWMMPTPRPYCATAPDNAKSVCTSTLEPLAAGSSRKTEAALAPPRPFASVPCAVTRAV